MTKKNSNFFEQHIEKIVMAIAAIVCMWILVTRVLISPNYVSYDGTKFNADEIDNHIHNQAELVEDKLNGKVVPKGAYDPCFPKFTALVDLAINDVDLSVSLPQPIVCEFNIRDNREYQLPQIGEVNEINVEHIRTVAYIPTEEINEENNYKEAENHEPNNIDLVTVEAKFDVAKLYESFYESFAGEEVKEEWRDPCLAEPIFSAVHLQRQELLADSSWSDWKNIERSKIDPRKKMFEIIEEVENLPAGGIKVRLLQYKDAEAKKDLLQPETYQIASANEDWFPPSLHKEYTKLLGEIASREKRKAMTKEKESRDREREQARSSRKSRTPRSTSSSGGGSEAAILKEIMNEMNSQNTKTKKRDRKRSKKTRSGRKGEKASKSTDDIYKKFDKIAITEKTNFSEILDPLVLWAHDDTVEEDKTYRYRMRLGVFNPIVGTNQLNGQNKQTKNNVVLWSDFSEVTKPVEIPLTLYFFPRDLQETTKSLTVTVSKYVLGYWYSKDFTVKTGEMIGRVVEYEPEDEENRDVTVPEMIDYSTGAILVDIVPVNDWEGGKNIRSRAYFEMLYSFDGINIEHALIKSRYWRDGLAAKYNEIRRLKKEAKEPLRAWGSKAVRRGVETDYGSEDSENNEADYMEQIIQEMMGN